MFRLTGAEHLVGVFIVNKYLGIRSSYGYCDTNF
jgi:hypothetical protein